MANGRARITEPSALGVRVDNLADDVHGFRLDIGGLRSQMATKDDLASLSNLINSLSQKYDAARSPNWQAMGVAVSVLVVIGGMAYLPVSMATNDLKSATLRLEVILQDNRVAVAQLQEKSQNLQMRYDAISARLAELIRTGK